VQEKVSVKAASEFLLLRSSKQVRGRRRGSIAMIKAREEGGGGGVSRSTK
jgi:hypothetical protein